MRRTEFWSMGMAALLAAAMTFFFAGFAGPAEASPRTKPASAPKSIDDCERFKEALAYNACLASFGPERRHGAPMVSQEVSTDGDGKAETAGKAENRYSRRSNRYGRSHRGGRSRYGRASATFSVPESIISGHSLRGR
ncbi:hypothetical protein ACFONL_00690 [Camelimonas fluminis]|uniref:Conjugative transfer region protein TrbK n=1 Tax=Camelimonas fluminis TaxID=1576911 RepID=A0ABV7UBN5_9HYPH|nr:hypothetical protein [Camelimonas fluminis]